MKSLNPVKLISAATASKILASPARVVPIDSTWYMPNAPQNARNQFDTQDRIKSAVFFDLDEVCCKVSKFPHMLPPHRAFDEAVSRLGINRSDSLLVYDRSGIFSGPRAAWTFSLYGHPKVYLLDHYKDFQKESGSDLEIGQSSQSSVEQSVYEGIDSDQFFDNYRAQVIEFDELADLVAAETLTTDYVVFDARSAGRFSGRDPEPRPGLPSGHVPGALSLPFTMVLNDNGNYKSREELLVLFKERFNLDLEGNFSKKGIIVMCGTGVTAVILKLAIEKVSDKIPIRVYDGSWTEWAQRAPEMIEKDVE